MKMLTLYRTLRRLRIRQVIARVRFQFRRVRVGEVNTLAIVEPVRPWIQPAPVHGDYLGGWRFRILNQYIDVGDAGGWNPAGRDRLLLYHLHYFDVLNARANSVDARSGAELIARWIADNPASRGNGWEPYPLSLRIVNWIKWHLGGNRLSDAATRSLFLQVRALVQQIEYHLLANHLFANAKALYFAGLFFDHPEALTWKALGARILRDEVQEQIFSDGGHFELSAMYHGTITADLLDIVNISRVFGDQSLPGFDLIAAKMISWLSLMTHPDGEVAYFNDATKGVAPTLSELKAYAARLEIDCTTKIDDGINDLSPSGYVRYQRGCQATFIDIGRIGPDYQPGHAHCDLLSFELSLGEQRHLVNTGISTYNTGARRHEERATASHNTVSIAETEQSEIWKAFRVGRRAEPIDIDIGPQYVQAAHDGYRHKGVIHRRRFEFGDGRLRIDDLLDSNSTRTGAANFHFHPNVRPVLVGDVVEVDGLKMTFSNAREVKVIDYEFCAGFNKRVLAKKVIVTFEKFLSTTINYENSIYKR